MRPPICKYSVHSNEWKAANGGECWDAVAMIDKCPHEGHTYVDFDEKLKRFNRDLNLGFDLKMGRWCIYRWMPEAESLDYEIGVGHVHRYMDIIFDLKWAVERRRKDGSKFMTFHYRNPGDWVFRYLREFKREKLLGYNTWVGEELKSSAAKAEADSKAAVSAFVKDWSDDVMSWADRGNPGQLRQSVVAPRRASGKAPKAKAKAK